MSKEIFDMESLRNLEKLPLIDAKNEALKIVSLMTKTKVAVVNRLKSDIERANASREVSRIMWQVYLSGTGFGTLGSQWKKHYAQV